MADRLSRALAYLEKVPPAVSGSGGHNATLRAACECVRFGLSDAEMWEALQWFNNNRCSPPWSEKELRHKMDDAKKKAVFGERAAPTYGRPVHKPVRADALRERMEQRRAKNQQAARRPPLADVPTSAIVEELAERGALPVYQRSEAEEDAWWAAVFAERAMSDPAYPGLPLATLEPGAWVDAEPPEPPPPADDDAPAPWDGCAVPIADLPAFRAEHGLSIAGAEWLPGEPTPRLYVWPMSADMGRGVKIAEPS